MEETQSMDVSAQLKRIADHLGFLEKKLDALLEQTRNRRPFNSGFGGDRPQRGYRPHRGPGYPSRHTRHGVSHRYEGHHRGPGTEPDGNRADYASHGNYQRKYVPHRGSR